MTNPAKRINLMLFATIGLSGLIGMSLALYALIHLQSDTAGSAESEERPLSTLRVHEDAVISPKVEKDTAGPSDSVPPESSPESSPESPKQEEPLDLSFGTNPRLQLDGVEGGGLITPTGTGGALNDPLRMASEMVARRLTNDVSGLRLSSGTVLKDTPFNAGVIIDPDQVDHGVSGYEIGNKKGSISYSEDDQTFKLQLKKNF